MSLVRKMQEGAKTPTLYTIYEKQYDFNELLRAADLGLAEHLAGLKRGIKDEAQFRDAYNNIMMGIKDGSITYQDGRFIDTKYGYHNSPDKDRNKDYYGLMANYIFSKMGKSREYVKPEDTTKIKWNGNSSVGQALIRALYNSDTENIAAFTDLDRDDLKSTKNRATELFNRATDIRNRFDDLFTGYTDALRTEQLGYLDSAIEALRDGSFDAGDYLALSRAFGNLNYSDMFSNGAILSETLNNQSTPNNPPSQIELFQLFMNEKHPQHTFVDRGVLLRGHIPGASVGLTPKAIKSFNTMLDQLSDDDFSTTLLGSLLSADTYNKSPFKIENLVLPREVAIPLMLNYLKENGELSGYDDGNGIYYLPGTYLQDEGSGIVWNTNTGDVSTADYLRIPYFRKQIMNEFNNWLLSRQGRTSSPSWLDPYGFYREGGILKAYDGSVMDRGSNWLAVPNTKENAQDLSKWKGYYKLDEILDNIPEFWNGSSNNLSAQLIVDGLNEVGRIRSGLSFNKAVNATGFKEFNEKFDGLGLNEFFMRDPDRFDYDGPSTTSRAELYDRLVERHTLGSDSPLFLNNDLIYFDPNSSTWKVSSEDLVVPDPVNVLPDNNKLIDPDLKIYGYHPNDNNSDKNRTTKIDLTTGDGSGNGSNGSNFSNTLERLTPDLIGAGRLAISLNTNNRVAKTVKETLTPVLKSTYERYSPVTGAFSEMLLRNRQGALALASAYRPFTSDARLAAARMAEGQRLANELQYQGFLADDKEIKRTKAEALVRLEDNMARRSEVANFNRASINQTNRERAELEATRLRRNWQSWDNYLLGIEGRLRYKQLQKEAMKDKAAETALGTQYLEAIAKLDTMYKEANPNATTSTMLADTNYTDAVRALLKLYQYNIYNLGTNGYLNPYKGYVSKSYEDIMNSYKFSKSGGQLKPSAAYLINKVIRNESNT